MSEQTIHLIHDTPGGKQRREGIDNAITLMTVGVLLILVSIGGVVAEDYKLAFWVFLIGVGLIFIGIKLGRMNKRPRDSIGIHFD